MRQTRSRFGRRLLGGVTIALAWAAVSLVSVPTASANSDADAWTTISIEIQKFNEELVKWWADLQAKGESAQTGELTAASASCDEQPSTRPFLGFGDLADYTPLPGGTFEDGARGWRLENEARIVRGNSSFFVSGASDRRSLAIPKGSSVTTRPLCVTEAHPTLRFFTRTKGSSSARLWVEVLYEDLGGSVKVLPIAYLRASSTWQPTSIVPLHVNLRARLAADRTAAVALRFTAEEEGTWYLDDVFVDPFRSR
jgi:hypothetical protein